MRGVTVRMTPVSRYSMLLTTGALAEITEVALAVVMGTRSPTCSRALSFSTISNCGAETTRTMVTACKACRANWVEPVPWLMAKPGNSGLSNPLNSRALVTGATPGAATAPITAGMLAALLSVLAVPRLLKKNCIP